MQVLPVIAVVMGTLVAIVLVCLAAVWVEKKYPSENYDERQKLARGQASSLSLGIGAVYFIGTLIVMVRQVDGVKTIEPYLLVLAGLLLMVMVDHTYCVICHAALPLSQKPIMNIVCYTLCGLIDLWYFDYGLALIPLSLVGKGTKPLVYLLLGIAFLYLALTHTIQFLRSRKERE